MTTIASIAAATIQLPEPEFLADESHLAAAAFLADWAARRGNRYEGPMERSGPEDAAG